MCRERASVEHLLVRTMGSTRDPLQHAEHPFCDASGPGTQHHLSLLSTPFSIPTHRAATEDKAQPEQLNIHHMLSYSGDLSRNKPRQGKPDQLPLQRAHPSEI